MRDAETAKIRYRRRRFISHQDRDRGSWTARVSSVSQSVVAIPQKQVPWKVVRRCVESIVRRR
jgi:hypothetical protein